MGGACSSPVAVDYTEVTPEVVEEVYDYANETNNGSATRPYKMEDLIQHLGDEELNGGRPGAAGAQTVGEF